LIEEQKKIRLVKNNEPVEQKNQEKEEEQFILVYWCNKRNIPKIR